VAPLFLLFTVLVAALVGLAIIHYLDERHRLPAFIGLATWLLYSGALGYSGILADTNRTPPGMMLIFGPIILFIVLFLLRGGAVQAIAESLPIPLLIGAQSFRIIVELFIHRLGQEGLMPRMLTYEGANFDILAGLSAPIVAWLYGSGRRSGRLALAWNMLGLALLLNIITRAVLTAPGPLQLLMTEVPNRAGATFPFSFIPALMAPLALTLHVLAIRALWGKLRMPLQNAQ